MASTTSVAGSSSKVVRCLTGLWPTPIALADLAVIPPAPGRASLECEPVLYIPAKAHRAATGEELHSRRVRARAPSAQPAVKLDFDDQLEMKRRLPRLTRLCWPDEIEP